MPIQIKNIPAIPSNVDVANLQPNLKLYNDEKIKFIKDNQTTDGRHRYIPTDTKIIKAKSCKGKVKYKKIKIKAERVKLKYAVIVQDGKYFAVYRGKEKVIGKGKFSHVKSAQDLDTGEWVALKVLKPRSDKSSHVAEEVHELDKAHLLIKTGQPEQPVVFNHYSKSKERPQDYILMEYARGQELSDFEKSSVKMSPILWINLAIKMTDLVKSLQNDHTLHRDIKLENMRYDHRTRKLWLVDFGHAADADSNGEFKGQPYGTAVYMPNEIKQNYFVDRETIYSEKTEVYSLGVSLALLLGLGFELEHPSNFFYDKLEIYKETDEKFLSNERIPDPAIRLQVSKFIRKMTDAIPILRPSVADTVNFFNDIEKQMNTNDKTLQVGILDIKDYYDYVKSNPDYLGSTFISNLRNMDQVKLIDSEYKTDPLYYARVSQELEKNGIRVGSQLFVYDPGTTVTDIVKAVRDANLGYVEKYFRVHPSQMTAINDANVSAALLAAKNATSSGATCKTHDIGLFAVPVKAVAQDKIVEPEKKRQKVGRHR